jgi:hypothetical protein
MRTAFSTALILTILFVGCSGESEPALTDAPPPPPPPTPQEMATEIVKSINLDAPPPPPGSKFPPAEADKIKNVIKQKKTALSTTEDGKRALAMVSRRIDQKLRTFEQSQLWEHVLVFSELHTILNPGSKKFVEVQQRAVAELQRPEVTVKGFVSDGNSGQKIAFLDIYLPLEGETINDRMRIGEEKYGIKFVEVIGRDQGVLFEYMATGDTFEVLTSKASR